MSGVPEPGIDEFLASPFVEAALRRNAGRYRTKWSRLIQKAHLSGMSVSDPALSKRINSQRSWNWSAFLFAFFWGVYRRVKYSWTVLIAVLVLTCLSAALPDSIADRIGQPLGIAIAVVYGMLGNSWLLTTLLAKRHEPPETLAPSVLHAIMAVVVYIVAAMAFVMFVLLP